MRRVSLWMSLIVIVLATAAGVAPATTLAQTPVPAGDDTLLSLLHLMPEDRIDGSGVWYRNYEIQLSTLGIAEERAGIDPETWSAAMREVPAPVAMTDPMAAIWRESLGFDARDLDAVLEGGVPPHTVTILRGDFDVDAMPALWEGAGYTATETDGVTWHTLGRDNVLDMDHPLHGLHRGMFSHLVLLDDRTVVGTDTRADLERVIALHHGGEGSLADGPAAALADAPSDLVYGGVVDGSFLTPILDAEQILGAGGASDAAIAQIEVLLAEVEAEARRMPPIALALVGVTAGQIASESDSNGPRSRAVALLVPVDPATAGSVVDVVAERAETTELPFDSHLRGRQYADLFEAVTVEVSANGTSVIVDLVPQPDVPATLPIDLLARRQLSLFYWVG